MLIRFSKSRHGPVLVCTRDDGSITGMKSEKHGGFFVRHDLMHYAVEAVLGFREAFWGLVAGLDGRPAWSIESFSAPGAAKNLPAQAVIAEFIVGRLDQVALFDDKPITAEELNQHIQQVMENSGGTAGEGAQALPTVTQKQIGEILNCFITLFAQFQALPEGGHLDLAFPATTDAVAAREVAGSAWPKATMRKAAPRHS